MIADFTYRYENESPTDFRGVVESLEIDGENLTMKKNGDLLILPLGLIYFPINVEPASTDSYSAGQIRQAHRYCFNCVQQGALCYSARVSILLLLERDMEIERLHRKLAEVGL